jgi:hypothetical protein
MVVALLLLSTLAVATLPATAESPLSETRRKLRAARARLMETRRSDAELLAVIGQLGGQLNTTRARLAAAELALDRISAMIAGEERRIARLEAQRKARMGVVKERARAMYILGPGMGAEALLASSSIEEFINRSSTLDFALRFDKVVMDDLARIADQARKARAALTVQMKRAAAVRHPPDQGGRRGIAGQQARRLPRRGPCAGARAGADRRADPVAAVALDRTRQPARLHLADPRADHVAVRSTLGRIPHRHRHQLRHRRPHRRLQGRPRDRRRVGRRLRAHGDHRPRQRRIDPVRA